MRVGALPIFAIAMLTSVAARAQDATKTADDFAGKWVRSYAAGDAKGLAAMFTENGVFNAPSGAVIRGREAIANALAGRMKAGWTKETVATTAAGKAGAAVWASGDYSLIGSGDVAGKQTGGHFGWVLVREGKEWHAAMLAANVSPAQ